MDSIDEYRMSGNWECMIEIVRKRNRNVSAAVAQLCEAQYHYFQKRDLAKALTHLKESIHEDSAYFDSRVLMSQILMESCYSSEANDMDIDDSSINVDNIELIDLLEDSSAYPTVDMDKIAKLLINSGIKIKSIILRALSCLSNADVSTIVNDLLIELSNRSILSPLSVPTSPVMQSSLQHFVLLIVRKFLSDANQSLGDIIDLYKTKAVSEYRLYLWLDAITARAVVHESLKDSIGAKNDVLSILQNVFGISWDMFQNNAKVPPLKIPDSCSRLAALSVSRLLAYSRRPGGSKEDFDRVMEFFAYPTGVLRSAAPLPLIAGLTVECALIELRKGKNSVAPLSFYLSNSNRGDDAGDEKDVTLQCIEKAYDFLEVARATLSRGNILRSTMIQDERRTLLYSMPKTESDPEVYHSMASLSFIATFAAAIWKMKSSLTGKKFDVEALTALEWASTNDIFTQDDANLLWNLSSYYDRVGEGGKARNLLLQCHASIKAKQKERVSRSTSLYRENMALLNWLGLEYQATENTWLPATKYLEISMRNEVVKGEQVEDLIVFAKTALVDIYPTAEAAVLLDVLLAEVHATESAQIPLSMHYLSPSDIALRTGLDKLYVNFLEEASSPPTAASIFESYFALNNNFQGDSAANYKQDLQVQILSSLSQNEGIYNLLYLLAKACQCRARFAEVRDVERQKLQMIALRVFTLLTAADTAAEKKERLLKALTSDLAFHHAISLVELRYRNAAVNLIREELSDKKNVSSDMKAKFLHLLALLISVKHDDPSAIATAVALCQSARQASKYDLSCLLTLAHLHHLAGDVQSSLELLDQLVSEITSEYEAIFRNEGEGAENTATKKVSSRKNARKSIFSPSMATMEADSSDNAPPSPAADSGKSPRGGGSTFANKRALTSLLVSAAKLFRKSGKFSRARQCLESGFRYLFLLEEDQTNDLRRLYSASVAKEEEAITTLSRLPTLLGWRLPEACGEEGNSSIIHCHKALCWQCPHFRDCEAEILSECGNLILAEEDDRRVTHPYHSSQYPSQAPELFHMAIAVYPNHAQSLLALAHYELGRQRALSSPNESGEELRVAQSAYRFVLSAMRQRDLHADGWHLYGLVLQALNNETLGDEIMEAFVISMECQQHNPVRPFATVLV